MEYKLDTCPSLKTFIISIAIVFIIYTGLTYTAIKVTDASQVGMLGYIPVIIFSWIFGLKLGIVSAIAILLGNAITFTFLSPPSHGITPIEPIVGMISHVIMALLFGSLSELVHKLRHEIAQRKKAEAELHEHREHLEELVKQRTTELEQAHEHLRQAEKMEALGQLTGGIVHDFNNMLGGIIGFADLIKRKYAKNDQTLENYTRMIFETSERAAELISKLLAFARKGDFQVEPISINGLIANTVKLLEHSLGRNITLDNKPNNGSPVIMGDYTQLQNVLINLAVNARDAMPRGGTLSFSCETTVIDTRYAHSHPMKLTPGDYVMVSVSDTGTGIDEATRKKIFEPFFTTKAKGKGTGMGLASTYGTVKNHNGSIEVYSEMGKGTTFKIYLPLADEKDARIKETGVIIKKRSGTILLVDDEEIMREVGSEMLTDLGYTVIIREDGEQCVEYYREHSNEIDLIILDIMMPNLDGYSCFRELKKINPNVRAIIASGYTINGMASDLIKEGAASFIQKPFDAIRLSKAIDKAQNQTES